MWVCVSERKKNSEKGEKDERKCVCVCEREKEIADLICCMLKNNESLHGTRKLIFVCLN